MRIAVIGATGLVGRKLSAGLASHGHEVIRVARSLGVDAVTGEGLASALSGATAIIDVSSPGYGTLQDMQKFFEATSSRLPLAAREAGIAHYVALSAVGADTVDSGYFKSKRYQEEAVRSYGIPYSIVRSAPLFEFLYNLVMSDGNAEELAVPPIVIQPIGVRWVASQLAEIALAQPQYDVTELYGPAEWFLPDLAMELATATEDPRRIIQHRAAAYFGGQFNGEKLVYREGAKRMGATFETWLQTWLAGYRD